MRLPMPTEIDQYSELIDKLIKNKQLILSKILPEIKEGFNGKLEIGKIFDKGVPCVKFDFTDLGDAKSFNAYIFNQHSMGRRSDPQQNKTIYFDGVKHRLYVTADEFFSLLLALDIDIHSKADIENNNVTSTPEHNPKANSLSQAKLNEAFIINNIDYSLIPLEQFVEMLPVKSHIREMMAETYPKEHPVHDTMRVQVNTKTNQVELLFRDQQYALDCLKYFQEKSIGNDQEIIEIQINSIPAYKFSIIAKEFYRYAYHNQINGIYFHKTIDELIEDLLQEIRNENVTSEEEYHLLMDLSIKKLLGKTCYSPYYTRHIQRISVHLIHLFVCQLLKIDPNFNYVSSIKTHNSLVARINKVIENGDLIFKKIELTPNFYQSIDGLLSAMTNPGYNRNFKKSGKKKLYKNKYDPVRKNWVHRLYTDDMIGASFRGEDKPYKLHTASTAVSLAPSKPDKMKSYQGGSVRLMFDGLDVHMHHSLIFLGNAYTNELWWYFKDESRSAMTLRNIKNQNNALMSLSNNFRWNELLVGLPYYGLLAVGAESEDINDKLLALLAAQRVQELFQLDYPIPIFIIDEINNFTIDYTPENIWMDIKNILYRPSSNEYSILSSNQFSLLKYFIEVYGRYVPENDAIALRALGVNNCDSLNPGIIAYQLNKSLKDNFSMTEAIKSIKEFFSIEMLFLYSKPDVDDIEKVNKAIDKIIDEEGFFKEKMHLLNDLLKYPSIKIENIKPKIVQWIRKIFEDSKNELDDISMFPLLFEFIEKYFFICIIKDNLEKAKKMQNLLSTKFSFNLEGEKNKVILSILDECLEKKFFNYAKIILTKIFYKKKLLKNEAGNILEKIKPHFNIFKNIIYKNIKKSPKILLDFIILNEQFASDLIDSLEKVKDVDFQSIKLSELAREKIKSILENSEAQSLFTRKAVSFIRLLKSQNIQITYEDFIHKNLPSEFIEENFKELLACLDLEKTTTQSDRLNIVLQWFKNQGNKKYYKLFFDYLSKDDNLPFDLSQLSNENKNIYLFWLVQQKKHDLALSIAKEIDSFEYSENGKTAFHLTDNYELCVYFLRHGEKSWLFQKDESGKRAFWFKGNLFTTHLIKNYYNQFESEDYLAICYHLIENHDDYDTAIDLLSRSKEAKVFEDENLTPAGFNKSLFKVIMQKAENKKPISKLLDLIFEKTKITKVVKNWFSHFISDKTFFSESTLDIFLAIFKHVKFNLANYFFYFEAALDLPKSDLRDDFCSLLLDNIAQSFKGSEYIHNLKKLITISIYLGEDYYLCELIKLYPSIILEKINEKDNVFDALVLFRLNLIIQNFDIIKDQLNEQLLHKIIYTLICEGCDFGYPITSYSAIIKDILDKKSITILNENILIENENLLYIALKSQYVTKDLVEFLLEHGFSPDFFIHGRQIIHHFLSSDIFTLACNKNEILNLLVKKSTQYSSELLCQLVLLEYLDVFQTLAEKMKSTFVKPSLNYHLFKIILNTKNSYEYLAILDENNLIHLSVNDMVKIITIIYQISQQALDKNQYLMKHFDLFLKNLPDPDYYNYYPNICDENRKNFKAVYNNNFKIYIDLSSSDLDQIKKICLLTAIGIPFYVKSDETTTQPILIHILKKLNEGQSQMFSIFGHVLKNTHDYLPDKDIKTIAEELSLYLFNFFALDQSLSLEKISNFEKKINEIISDILQSPMVEYGRRLLIKSFILKLITKINLPDTIIKFFRTDAIQSLKKQPLLKNKYQSFLKDEPNWDDIICLSELKFLQNIYNSGNSKIEFFQEKFNSINSLRIKDNHKNLFFYNNKNSSEGKKSFKVNIHYFQEKNKLKTFNL